MKTDDFGSTPNSRDLLASRPSNAAIYKSGSAGTGFLFEQLKCSMRFLNHKASHPEQA